MENEANKKGQVTNRTCNTQRNFFKNIFTW
jgi:hypothetical protein